MARKRKRPEYLSSDNAISVANRGNNAAFTQSHGQPYKDPETGKWKEGDMVTSTKSGRMSANGKSAGGYTHTFSDKESGRQSGRSKMASRRQRYYDVRIGLGLAGG